MTTWRVLSCGPSLPSYGLSLIWAHSLGLQALHENIRLLSGLPLVQAHLLCTCDCAVPRARSPGLWLCHGFCPSPVVPDSSGPALWWWGTSFSQWPLIGWTMLAVVLGTTKGHTLLSHTWMLLNAVPFPITLFLFSTKHLSLCWSLQLLVSGWECPYKLIVM